MNNFDFYKQFKLLDRDMQYDLARAAEQAGFMSVVQYCEALAVAARLGELSLRSQYGPERRSADG